MINDSLHSPFAVNAVYAEQSIAEFQNNPLIGALPPSLDDKQLARHLFALPDFSEEQRNLPTHDRLHSIGRLSRFVLPLPRHIQLARAIDSLMRAGYVGRAPRTKEQVSKFQAIYEAQQAGAALIQQVGLSLESQLSSAFIGLSGMGKTTTVRRTFARFPQAIFHPTLNVWQIPCLHVEAPHDGITIKGLVGAIYRQLDRILPKQNFYAKYAAKSHRTDNTNLLTQLAVTLIALSVGILVIDEIQNLENAGSGKKTLMSALVSIANELGIPVLFIGTNKAKHILSLDFRQARRSVASGFSYWGPLKRSGKLSEPDEWETFLIALWRCQWVLKSVPLTETFSNLMFYLSQGIIDVAIKLFCCAQWRALLDRSECITVQTLDAVAKHELALIEPMIDALRRGDTDSLEKYDDLYPIDMDALQTDAMNQYEGVRGESATIGPGHVEFIPSLIKALVAAHLPFDRAESVANAIAAEAKVRNILEGVEVGIKRFKAPPLRRASNSAQPSPAKVELEPVDYRNALAIAAHEGITVLDAFRKRGELCDLAKELNLA
jgi:hypothetical protein